MLPAKARIPLLAAVAVAFPALPSLPAAELSTPPIASYEIVCRLSPEKKTVEGTQLLTWTNSTSRPTTTLAFHLYLNAFRNTLSTFWREHGSRVGTRPLPESWGSIDVTRMILADGTDLLPAMRFVSPDDGNPDDRTVAEVTLPRPVGPGETISLSIDFLSRLPRVSTRTGYKGDFFLVAQWFPKIGVLEESGWNCHQFHSNSEFFADFGTYDVTIEVPARYRGKVGATGRILSEREISGGRVAVRFRQENVHDFAWTADPDALVLKDYFRAPGIADVELILFLQPEHSRQADRYFRAAREGLSGFGRLLGSYPYPTLTIVDPPWGGTGAGGMEYPTLITGGTRLVAPAALQSPERVTVHEVGHQYFYGLLASNEFEEAWLDEGLTTYVGARVVEAAYGPAHAELSVFGIRVPLGIEKRHPLDTNSRYFAFATEDAPGVPSWKVRSREAFGALVYSKTALTLASLERLIGTPAMDRALRLYATRWRLRHPKTEDFLEALREATGSDWRWFFDRTLFSSGVIDYAVDEASSERAAPPRGIFERDRGEPGRPPPPPARTGWNSAVTVARHGSVPLPVDVLLRFANGRTHRSSWDGVARWKRFRVAGGPRLVEGIVDPDEKILLDADRINNGRRTDPDPRAASRWTARVVFWLQNFFDFATLAW